MAPAQVMDIPQTPSKYTHKKFQGKQQQQPRYAHKKFGTRQAVQQIETTEIFKKPQFPAATAVTTEQQQSKSSKRSAGDIFRPYALDNEDQTSRKRKHYELQDEETQQHQSSFESPSSSHTTEFKRFAPSPILSPVYTSSPFVTPLNSAFIPRLHHYQFDAQTFSLILQKQQAALCMGEILKRQANLNIYNLMGQ